MLCSNILKTYCRLNFLNMTNTSNNWFCYILHSTVKTNITYNGSTNNIKRRLRQHNGELVGGAKATSKNRPHKIYCLVSGLPNQIEALRCEWKIKHPTGHKRRPNKYCGAEGRIKGLNLMLKEDKTTSKSDFLIKDMDLSIRIIKKYAHLIDQLDYINIIIVDEIDLDYPP